MPIYVNANIHVSIWLWCMYRFGKGKSHKTGARGWKHISDMKLITLRI